METQSPSGTGVVGDGYVSMFVPEGAADGSIGPPTPEIYRVVFSMESKIDPESFVGRTARSFSRVLYEYKGNVDNSDGDLIIDFDGTKLWLTSEPPYDSLVVKSGTWTDSFKESVSPENAEFIATHGKWTLRVCDADLPFRECVGRKLVSVSNLMSRHGCLAGLRLQFEERSLYFYIGGDMSIVDVSLRTDFTEQ